MHIRPAIFQDIPGMLQIQSQNLLSNQRKNKQNVSSKGFLISQFSDLDAKSHLLNTNQYIHLVSVQNKKICGYTFGCDFHALDNANRAKFIKASNVFRQIVKQSPVFYMQHIAKSPEQKGIGHLLLNALLEQASQRGYAYVFCQVAKSPIANQASMAFHQRAGFSALGEVEQGEFQFHLYITKLKR